MAKLVFKQDNKAHGPLATSVTPMLNCLCILLLPYKFVYFFITTGLWILMLLSNKCKYVGALHCFTFYVK